MHSSWEQEPFGSQFPGQIAAARGEDSRNKRARNLFMVDAVSFPYVMMIDDDVVMNERMNENDVRGPRAESQFNEKKGFGFDFGWSNF
jgi:hypothetical protein